MRGVWARRHDHGSAAVEFALVLPVLLLIIFGIIDFGRMLHAKIILTEAAREGARAAAIVDETSALARIDAVAGTLGPIGIPGGIGGCPDPPDPTDDAIVTLTHQFQFITPVGVIVGGSDGAVELEATGLMPCLQ